MSSCAIRAWCDAVASPSLGRGAYVRNAGPGLPVARDVSSGLRAELAVLDRGGERSPLAGGERQDRPVRVLGVAYADLAAGQAGDLDAVAVGVAGAGLVPCRPGVAHALVLLR
jgi:hypothetical protein